MDFYFWLGKDYIQSIVNYVLLIVSNKMTYEEIPSLFNLREAVIKVKTDKKEVIYIYIIFLLC